MPQVAFGGESSNSGNKAGDRAMASLWIRRLKPQEEPGILKGETFVSDVKTWQGLHAGNFNAGSSMHYAGSNVQEASPSKTLGIEPLLKIRKLNGDKAVLKDADASIEQLSSGDSQDSVAKRHQNLLKQGQGQIVSLGTSSTSGFGQQINQITYAKSKRELPIKRSMTVDTNVNSRCTSEAPMTLHTCSQVIESQSQVLHGVRVQAVDAFSSGKPPLPRSHNKAGLPPRPTSHKSSSFLAWSASKISSLPTGDKLVAMPLQDVSRHSSHGAFIKEGSPATNVSEGPLLKEESRAKEDSVGCQDALLNDNGMDIEAAGVLPRTLVPSVEPGLQQLLVPHGDGKFSFFTSRPLAKCARQDFEEEMDVLVLGAESPKKLDGVETGKQAFCTLLKDSGKPKTPSECTVVSSQANITMEAVPSASTSASFPWEMFAGPSRSTREEFVEVYNRARNELKNQRSSNSITKVSCKEMENRSIFSLEPATCLQDILTVKHKGQASDQQLQQEILEKRSPMEGIDCVSEHGGVKATAVYAQTLQKELFSEKHNCPNYLEGDFDMDQGDKSQAFQSKGSSSFIQDQSSSPLHGCAEPPAVGHRDKRLMSDKSSQFRWGFTSGTMRDGAASTVHKLLCPASVGQTDGDACDNKKTFMLLSKRQLGMFDSNTGKDSLQRVTLPRKSDAWLQRWCPPYISRINGCQEHKLGQDSVGDMLRPATKSNEHVACVKEDLKKSLIEEGVLYQRISTGADPKCSKVSSEKALASAAAMAIVGTAARQFCALQPEHKGSFAFWAGFGMSAPQTPEHFTERGKRKLTFQADPSANP